MIPAYILLVFLILLFGANTVIRLPLAAPVDLAKTGAGGLRVQRGTWYVLEQGTYSVGPRLGAVSISSSFVPLYTSQHTYYCVTVRPESGGEFSMPVRVTGGKARSLENGEAVRLYGMASELTGEPRKQLEAAGQAQYVCLNDNGDTVLKRWASAAVFAVLTCLCAALLVRLAGKRTV